MRCAAKTLFMVASLRLASGCAKDRDLELNLDRATDNNLSKARFTRISKCVGAGQRRHELQVEIDDEAVLVVIPAGVAIEQVIASTTVQVIAASFTLEQIVAPIAPEVVIVATAEELIVSIAAPQQVFVFVAEELIVPRAAKHVVVPQTTVEHVVAVVTAHGIVAGVAKHLIVAGPAKDVVVARIAVDDVIAVVTDPALIGLPDAALLAEATRSERALVTLNIRDFVLLDQQLKATDQSHAGIVFVSTKSFPQNRSFIGHVVIALDRLLTKDDVLGGTAVVAEFERLIDGLHPESARSVWRKRADPFTAEPQFAAIG